MNKKLLGLAFLLILVLSFRAGDVKAAAGDLHDWAWSGGSSASNGGFGWISFNSTEAAAGGDASKTQAIVNINASGDWSGYAWSQYLGWISFNAADVTARCGSIPLAAAHLNSANGAVTGGAYAMVYSASANPSDGCIELSGTNHTSPTLNGTGGVTFNSASGRFVGYAWGGDTTRQTGPGWIQFNASYNASLPLAGIAGGCAKVTPGPHFSPPPVSIMFQAGPAPVVPGHVYNYDWGSGYVVSDTFSANYSDPGGSGPIVKIKDVNTGQESVSIPCPNVVVFGPLGAGDLTIGKTWSTATLSNYTTKLGNPFALKWNLTLQKDYSCVTQVNPDYGNPNIDANWKTGNLASVDNGDGTRTWNGHTNDPPDPTHLTAGSTASPLPTGVYEFKISCTNINPGRPPMSATANLKITNSNIIEI